MQHTDPQAMVSIDYAGSGLRVLATDDALLSSKAVSCRPEAIT